MRRLALLAAAASLLAAAPAQALIPAIPAPAVLLSPQFGGVQVGVHYPTILGNLADYNPEPAIVRSTCLGDATCGAGNVKAYLAGGALGVSLGTLQTYSGTITITVNGTPYTSDTIDLSGAASFADAASLIAAGFTSPQFTVFWNPGGGNFVFRTFPGSPSTITAADSGAFSTNLKLDAVDAYVSVTVDHGGASGNNNVAVGDNALNLLARGGKNVAVGELAGAAVSFGDKNTLIGYGVGGTIDLGYGNTLIGYHAGNYPLQTGANNIIIDSGFAEADTSASDSNEQINIGNTYVNSQDAPTIASGFGTSPSITHNAGAHVVTVDVGTSNTGNGVLAMPASPRGNGWACSVNDETTHTANVAFTQQTASTSTSVTVQGYTEAMATHAWVDHDVLVLRCDAY